MANYTTKPRSKKRLTVKKMGVLIIILLLVAGGSGYWWHKDHEVKITKTNVGTATSNPNVPGSQSQNHNPSTGANSSKGQPGTATGAPLSKDQNSNTPGTTPSSSTQPATPNGDFVSNFTPDLSGSPYPNTVTSTCNTTPGVQCTIEFISTSNSNKIIKLPAETTDANGNALWTNWTLQQYGFTQGSTWTVKAVATNGSLSASATDQQEFKVGP